MAWTAPKTYASNSAATSADRNTYERDNLNWLANDKPRCGAVRSTSQSISDGVVTAVTLPDAEDFDVGNMHDPGGGSPNLITVPASGGGLYHVQGIVTWASNSAGRRIILPRKNGSSVSGTGDTRAPDSAGSTVQHFGLYLVLAAGDTVDMTAQQTSGGSLNVTNARLQVVWVAF